MSKTAKKTTKAVQKATTPTPATLLELAVSNGADVEKLERLMDMQMKWEENEAKKAYHTAMMQFKENPPEICQDKKVSYSTGKGKTSYSHASLHNITTTINSALAKHGLTASWKTNQANGQISVSCIITHELGHSESTTLVAPPDTSGGKNSIQAIGSATTYLQRYTLMALTGLATKEQDDDGRGSTKTIEQTISEGQEADLISMLEEKNVAAEQVFQHFNVAELKQLTQRQFKQVINMLAATPEVK